LKVGRAGALKERFRTFWAYRYPGAARTFFTRWFWRATHSRLKPLAAVAKLIQRPLPNLLTYLRHHLTNAGIEGGQRGHPVGEEDRPRLPQRRALQDGHLLPLWRPRSLPIRKPVEPSSRSRKTLV
ncbi:MAG: transposase, partial [Candidatus Rokubacteria bacterium]|nr:transposase [Candidatus Rokubacteria bacterium]